MSFVWVRKSLFPFLAPIQPTVHSGLQIGNREKPKVPKIPKWRFFHFFHKFAIQKKQIWHFFRDFRHLEGIWNSYQNLENLKFWFFQWFTPKWAFRPKILPKISFFCYFWNLYNFLSQLQQQKVEKKSEKWGKKLKIDKNFPF